MNALSVSREREREIHCVCKQVPHQQAAVFTRPNEVPFFWQLFSWSIYYRNLSRGPISGDGKRTPIKTEYIKLLIGLSSLASTMRRFYGSSRRHTFWRPSSFSRSGHPHSDSNKILNMPSNVTNKIFKVNLRIATDYVLPRWWTSIGEVVERILTTW